MFSLVYGLWKHIFTKMEFHVLILGIDKAGKTVIFLTITFEKSRMPMLFFFFFFGAKLLFELLQQWITDIAGKVEVTVLEHGSSSSRQNCSHCGTQHWSCWSFEYKTCILGPGRSGTQVWNVLWTYLLIHEMIHNSIIPSFSINYKSRQWNSWSCLFIIISLYWCKI